MTKIDLKDRRILTELDMNANMPLTELAKKVGLSRQVVEYRIKRLKKEKIIFAQQAVLDSVVVGLKWYRVVFRLLGVTQEQKDQFISYLASRRDIMWLGEIGGNWDLIMNFVASDHFEFNKIFEDIIQNYGEFIKDYEILLYLNIHDYSRAYILKKPREEFYHEMKPNQDYHLDELDRKIVAEVADDSSKSNLELGSHFNVTANTINNRLKVMKKNKLLLGYRLNINPRVLGYVSHMLFLEIHKLDLKKEREFHEYIKSIPNVIYVVTHIGRWRIGMEIETQDDEEFQQIFVNIRGRFSELISNYESFPIFKDHVINYFPKGVLL